MAANGRRHGRMALVVASALAGLAALAAPASGDQRGGGDRRVRPLNPEAQTFIDEAAKASPTVARLLAALDQTDVIVMVQVALMPSRFGGDTRLIAVTSSCRYLVVRVDATRPPAERIQMLGHELQHAREVADAKDVRDEAGLAKLMSRIGRATGEGTFETDAAVAVGRQIGREVGTR